MACTLPRAPAGRALCQGKEGLEQGPSSGCLAAQTQRRTECTRLPGPRAVVCSPANPEADSLGLSSCLTHVDSLALSSPAGTCAAAGRPGSQPPGVRGCRLQPGALGAWCTPCGAESVRPSNRWRSPALALPFPGTELFCWSPWQCARHRPLSPPKGRLGPRCKGKEGAELRPGRRQWCLPASRSLLLPALEA